MTERLLVDLVVVLHAAFVVFVVAGALAVARWPRLAWLHLPAVAWAALVELAGWTCPLTPLEIRWREAAGGEGYEGGFVEHTLIPVLYPASLTRRVQTGLGVLVLALNAGAYAWLVARRRRRRNLRGGKSRPGRRALARPASGHEGLRRVSGRAMTGQREVPMDIQGRCYCGEVRYEVKGDPIFAGQCHCRECQYISGGSPNVTMGMPEPGFRYTQGKPKQFRRSDLESPVTREFCERCGTHILSRAPGLAGVVLLKVGTFDDPSVFSPQMAIFTVDKQSFHRIPEGIATFERMPG